MEFLHSNPWNTEYQTTNRPLQITRSPTVIVLGETRSSVSLMTADDCFNPLTTSVSARNRSQKKRPPAWRGQKEARRNDNRVDGEQRNGKRTRLLGSVKGLWNFISARDSTPRICVAAHCQPEYRNYLQSVTGLRGPCSSAYFASFFFYVYFARTLSARRSPRVRKIPCDDCWRRASTGAREPDSRATMIFSNLRRNPWPFIRRVSIGEWD